METSMRYVILGNDLRAVEFVGLKTTRIRGLGGEQVIFSNSDLLKSRIRNFTRTVYLSRPHKTAVVAE